MLVVTGTSHVASAQKTATVSADYTFQVSPTDNITFQNARIKSIEYARAKAISDQFGTLVASDFMSTEMGVTNDTRSFYVLDTQNSARGTWLEDLETPEVKVECVNNEILFTAHVKGIAREIKRASTEIEVTISNEPEIKGKKSVEVFNSGERIYLDFRAPHDGYVAIYLITGDEETSCLLPYRNAASDRVFVKGGRHYVFFDKNVDPTATQYKLKTPYDREFNQLVVIFSRQPFNKCTDFSSDELHPNWLSRKDFANWLLKNQRADDEMVVKRIWIAIDRASQTAHK